MSLMQRLSFNQMTADPWSLEQAVRSCSKNGVPYIGVWRHKLDGDAAKASAMIRKRRPACLQPVPWRMVLRAHRRRASQTRRRQPPRH